MFKHGAVLAAVLALAGCGAQSPTSVDGVDQNNLTSALGFIIQGRFYAKNGGVVTQRHAELADRYWGVLMRDLSAAGFRKADPKDILGYVRIALHEPIGPDSLIEASMYNDPVGGYYDPWNGVVHVPGDYDDPDGMLGARPAYQPLMHEYTHHWCQRTLGHLCLAKDGGHTWAMPNGQELWLVQWQNNAPAASLAMRAYSCSHLTDLSGPGDIH